MERLLLHDRDQVRYFEVRVRNAAHFKSRGTNYTCLHSQFKIVKYL